MRFFCSKAGPRAAPCLVKIPLYSRPSRFQTAFIISFLKNLRVEPTASAAPRLLPLFLFLCLFFLFLSFLFFFTLLFHVRHLCVPSIRAIPSFLVSPTNEDFIFSSFRHEGSVWEKGTKRETAHRIRSFNRGFLSIHEMFEPQFLVASFVLHCRDRIKMRIRRRLASLIRIYCDRSSRINSSLIGRTPRFFVSVEETSFLTIFFVLDFVLCSSGVGFCSFSIGLSSISCFHLPFPFNTSIAVLERRFSTLVRGLSF